VPEGSRALAGIGCHYMTVWMDRNTSTFSQMGGEGVAWIGQAPFAGDKHVFANLGDGTYFHRPAGDPRVDRGRREHHLQDPLQRRGGDDRRPAGRRQLSVQDIAPGGRRRREEDRHRHGRAREVQQRDQAAEGLTVHPPRELDDVQRELREVPGCTILIYDQTCATEKRRRRKRGTFPDPASARSSTTVCEGCGDCSVKSNCLSVEPLETELGTKRQINQSSCNKDFSCVNGFCPSFVTAEGAQVRKPKATACRWAACPRCPNRCCRRCAARTASS
jgi:indolepyruvate ferredoxin oxidoreductase